MGRLQPEEEEIMSDILRQLNNEMGEVVEQARRGLVQVKSGRQGGGAGIVWSPDGLIITNAHVVRGKSPQVVLPDGEHEIHQLLCGVMLAEGSPAGIADERIVVEFIGGLQQGGLRRGPTFCAGSFGDSIDVFIAESRLLSDHDMLAPLITRLA